MNALVISAVFVAVYLGMALGRVPGLAVDRTGIALTGAVVLLATGALGIAELPSHIELPTLILLFALMLLGGHFAAAHCFDFIGAWLSRVEASPLALLGLTVAVGGALSAVLVNDIVVFAFTPLLCAAMGNRGLDPRPYLLALAFSSNAGSAASLIGNPQNILIGELGQLDFLRYTMTAVPPAVIALVSVFAVTALVWRGALLNARPGNNKPEPVEVHPWLTTKSVIATAFVIGLMIALENNREIAVLAVATALMAGRRVSTRTLMRGVDWSLLVLISSLFVVTAAFTALPAGPTLVEWLRSNDLLPYRLSVLVPFAVIASNTIGNVPAVVLLVRALNDIPAEVLTALAVFSTLAGNLLLTGSLANIIVAERAALGGIDLSFGDFARTGIPITAIPSRLRGCGFTRWGISRNNALGFF